MALVRLSIYIINLDRTKICHKFNILDQRRKNVMMKKIVSHALIHTDVTSNYTIQSVKKDHKGIKRKNTGVVLAKVLLMIKLARLE